MRFSFTAARVVAFLLAARTLSGQDAARQDAAGQDAAGRADSLIRAAAQRGFSGIVRIDRKRATILEKSYGLANRAAGTRFTPSTIVQIGSNTKEFTTVALLQLHERGRLSMNDSIGKYFPGAPTEKRGITLWQLVRHQSGLPLQLGGDFEPISKERLIARAMATPLLSPPGTARSYGAPPYRIRGVRIKAGTR